MRVLASKVVMLVLVVVAFAAVTAVAKADGNGTQTTQYKVSYGDLGGVACAGVHQVGKNFPGFGQDSFTCTSTTGLPLVGVTPGGTITFVTGGWASDYYFFVLNQFVVNTSPVVGNVSLDGMSWSGVAKYF